MVHELGKTNSVFNTFIAEIRSQETQKDRMRFRRNLERIAEVMAYEISKTFPAEEKEIITPLGEADMHVISEQPVLVTILRAGLPFHQGFLNYFDAADNGFISAYRRSHKGGDFEIEVEYVSSPSIDDRTVILCDPMIATGSSVECVYQALKAKGTPKHIHIASAIASNQGITHIKSQLPENITIWAGAVDSELTAQSYIVPGLGDAGDLAYGRKNT
ncbi:MAG: uracil phosphoribosyltransferase [Flavobacteriales bacterium]|nr:uracil phosphoribosyltransferase [Flavobacteriales bacterium]